MGLLSSNINSRKRLSLKDAKIAPEERALPFIEPLKEVERPIGDEDVDYNKLLQVNPVLDTLIDAFYLVNKRTGEKLRKAPGDLIKAPQQEPKTKEEAEESKTTKEPGEPLKKPLQIKDNSKLSSLANEIFKGEYSLSKEEIVTRLQEETKVNQDRAEVGFNMMLEAGVVIQINQLNSYYLSNSTPF